MRAGLQRLAAVKRRGRAGPFEVRAERAERTFRMIPCGGRLEPSCAPSACNPASMIALFTCALGISSEMSTPRSLAPRTVSGGRPSGRVSTTAPIRISGSRHAPHGPAGE